MVESSWKLNTVQKIQSQAQISCQLAYAATYAQSTARKHSRLREPHNAHSLRTLVTRVYLSYLCTLCMCSCKRTLLERADPRNPEVYQVWAGVKTRSRLCRGSSPVANGSAASLP